MTRELKQSIHSLLKALSFPEIFLPLLTVMIVELNLLSFKQNKSVNGYFLNGFPLIHYKDWLQVIWEHYSFFWVGEGKAMRHSDESCSSPAGANAGSFDNQKVFINCYAYSKMPEIMLTGTHMHKILSSPGKPCPPGGWCYTTIILPGFDIYVPDSG